MSQVRLQPRETVILVEDFEAAVAWYRDTLGFTVVKRFDQGFRYANLENGAGIKLGIAPAAEMGVEPQDRDKNTVVPQFEVEDVPEFLQHVQSSGGSVTGGPTHNEREGFWFGSFADPEGNPFWIVDLNCP